MEEHLKQTDVMVVSEIPSDLDDKFGTSFSDKFHQVIRRFFTEHNATPVHCTYGIKCRKSDHKKKLQTVQQIKMCATNYLRKEIEQVAPKHIICLGSNAMYAVTGNQGFASKQGQRWFCDRVNAWIYPTYHPAQCMYNADKQDAFWSEMQMFVRMIKGEQKEFTPPYKIVTTLKGLRKVQQLIRESGGRAYADTETQGLDMFIDGQHVRCIQFCWDVEFGAVFIPLGMALEDDLYNGEREVEVWETKGKGKNAKQVARVVKEKIPVDRFWANGESLEQAVEILREILLETWLGWHNGKFDRKWLWMWGKRQFGKPIRCPRIWLDTQHISHIINENRASFKLKKLFSQEFSFPSFDIADKLTKDLSVMVPYASYDTVSGLMLALKYEAELAAPGMEKLHALYYKVIRPMDRIYTEMELEGWPINVEKAKAKLVELEALLVPIASDLDTMCLEKGIELDLEDEKRYSADDKVAELLFDKWKYPMASDPKLALTDDGKRSVNAYALLHIRNEPFVKLLSNYHKTAKALSTFLRPMIQQGETRGKLTTTYRLEGTVTGRPASGKEDTKSVKGSATNLQTLFHAFMVRGTEVDVKKCIEMVGVNPITGQEQVVGDADLSQIELRVAANESGDELMLWAYANDVDLHTYRAIRNLGIDKEAIAKGLDIDTWNYVLTQGEWAALDPKKKKYARTKAKPCIAEGSLVLTNHGLKEIEKVKLHDLVWDGVEWVQHEGVVYKGYKQVISVQGLLATPDHTVYLEDGTTASTQEVFDEKVRSSVATTEIAGNPVRYVGADRKNKALAALVCRGSLLGMRGRLRNLDTAYHPERNQGLSVPQQTHPRKNDGSVAEVRHRITCFSRQLKAQKKLLAYRRTVYCVRENIPVIRAQHIKQQCKRMSLSSKLNIRCREQVFQYPSVKNAMQSLRQYGTALYESERENASVVRKTRHREQVRKPTTFYSLLLSAFPLRIVQRTAGRQERKRWALRTWQHTFYHCAHEYAKQNQHALLRIRRKTNLHLRFMGFVTQRLSRLLSERKVHLSASVKRQSSGGDTGYKAAWTAQKAHVYDIVNAGPRHRFTASGILVGNCNFGYLYGMGWRNFQIYAQKNYNVDYSVPEAQASRALFFTDHNGLTPWYNRVAAIGARQGYVESLDGRRRNLPDLKYANSESDDKRRLYSNAVRQAINSPIQGFGSADLKYMCLIEIRKEMKARGWYGVSFGLFGEVHDSLCYWADRNIAIEAARIVQNTMKNPKLLAELGITLRVKLDADSALGPNYGQTVPWPEYQCLDELYAAIPKDQNGFGFNEFLTYVMNNAKDIEYKDLGLRRKDRTKPYGVGNVRLVDLAESK